MDQVKDEVLLERIARTYSDNEQITAIVEHLIASCDYYVARCIQESALREERDEQLAQAQQQLELTKTELGTTRGETEKLQALLSRKEDECAQQAELDEFAEMIFQLVAQGDELARALERKEKQCARQKVQIDYLNARVARYQRLIERLKQTWYGKFLIKIYHIMQKLGWI